MGGPTKIHAASLLPAIGILSIVIIGLAGSTFQTYFDPIKILKGNAVSETLMPYALSAAALAIAAVISGGLYAIGKAENGAAAASASSTALIAWTFGLLAFGFACKHAELGDFLHSISGNLKALSGTVIVLFLFETVYVILLHLVVARAPL